MSRKRSHEIKLRLNDKELDHLDKMVAKTNDTREGLLRLMIQGYTVQEVPKDYIMFYMNMAKICSTLRSFEWNRSLSEAEKAALVGVADELASIATVMRSIYNPYYKERKSEK